MARPDNNSAHGGVYVAHGRPRGGRRREALSARAPRGRKGIRPPCPGGYTGPARVNRTTNHPGFPGVTDAVSPSGFPMAPASDTRPVSSLPGQGTSCVRRPVLPDRLRHPRKLVAQTRKSGPNNRSTFRSAASNMQERMWLMHGLYRPASKLRHMDTSPQAP